MFLLRPMPTRGTEFTQTRVKKCRTIRTKFNFFQFQPIIDSFNALIPRKFFLCNINIELQIFGKCSEFYIPCTF